MSQYHNHDSLITVDVGEETLDGEAPAYSKETSDDAKIANGTNPDGQSSACTEDKPDEENTCLSVCLGFTILSPVILLIFIVLLILSIPATPLLYIFILLLRLLQLFTSGDKFDQASEYKFFIRMFMSFNLVFVIITMGIFYAIAKSVGGLKRELLIGLPITEWVEIICMLSGFYLLNFFISVSTVYVIEEKIPFSAWEAEQRGEVYETITEGISSLIFWWAESETMRRVPAFRKQQILGLQTHKWIEVLVFILLGYNVIRLVIFMAVWSIWKVCQRLDPIKNKAELSFSGFFMGTKYVTYCAIGMRRSIIILLTSVLVLLLWVLYMGSHLKGRTPEATSVFDFVTRTCVSLLVCSLLWLIKSCILLAWEAHAVYTRLSPLIVEKGKLLHFLGILSRNVYDLLDDMTYSNHHWKIKALKQHLFNEQGEKGCTLYDLYQVAKYLLEAKNKLSDVTYTSEIVNKYKDTGSNDSDDDAGTKSIEVLLKKALINDWQKDPEPAAQIEWDNFTKLLKKVAESQPQPQPCNEDTSHNSSPTDIYTEKIFESWVEESRKSCLSLAKSISCASELRGCLNKIISVLVVAAVFVLWLLLTGLATTQVLVLIGSPLLAATFIFGDTCKSAFQGLMFVYVLEPFSIGDLCVIDGEMMEVNSIGVWKTTFTKVGTHHGEVIHPNSGLMNKVVINYKTVFDWDDCLEFDAGSLGKGQIEELTKGIEKFIEDQKINKKQHIAHNVSVLATREFIKVTVHFKCTRNDSSWTFSDCHRKKDRLRSEFAVYIKNLIEDLKGVDQWKKDTEPQNPGSTA